MQWAKPRLGSGTYSKNPDRQKIDIEFALESDLSDSGTETPSFGPSSSNAGAGPDTMSSELHLSDTPWTQETNSQGNVGGHWPSAAGSGMDRLSAWDYYGRSGPPNGPQLPSSDYRGSYAYETDPERTTDEALGPNDQQLPQHNRFSWESSTSASEPSEKQSPWTQLLLPFLVVLVILGVAFATLLG